MKSSKLVILVCIGMLVCDFAFGKKYDPNKDYGFVLKQKQNGIENPPPNKARIYGFMPNDITNYTTTRYNATIHTLAQANEDFKEGYFFGFGRPGEVFYIDIVPSGEPLFISKKTMARKHIYFTPQAGKIYCVKMATKVGLFGGAKITLVDEEDCTTYVSQHIRSDFMRQWLEDKERFEKEQQKEKETKSKPQDSEWDW